jgi:hypothetical protein
METDCISCEARNWLYMLFGWIKGSSDTHLPLFLKHMEKSKGSENLEALERTCLTQRWHALSVRREREGQRARWWPPVTSLRFQLQTHPVSLPQTLLVSFHSWSKRPLHTIRQLPVTSRPNDRHWGIFPGFSSFVCLCNEVRECMYFAAARVQWRCTAVFARVGKRASRICAWREPSKPLFTSLNITSREVLLCLDIKLVCTVFWPPCPPSLLAAYRIWKSCTIFFNLTEFIPLCLRKQSKERHTISPTQLCIVRKTLRV